MKCNSFRVAKRKVVFSKGPIHLVDCVVSTPGSRKLSRQILEHPGSVVVIPRISKNRFLLIRQFRFAAKGWLWEFPAGGLEKGETLAEAARRELIEEVGYRPGRLRKITQFYPSPGISSEMMHLYLAEKLKPAFAKCDEDEEIKVHEFPLEAIEKMIASGRIVDAKTMIGFSYLRDRFGRRRK